ncbi:MAG: sulfite exporter TauE/SafE family protein [Gammaproteobacteria bacterium]|nr:sulfite exporter TauE/SafE family protein [Gammaproteobacteria bacterium]
MDIASDASSLALLAALLAVTGLLAGLIAGLLGVGGGIILVPVLESALQFTGFPKEWCMHVAVATSLATVIPTSIASSHAHHLRGGIDWTIAKAWAPGMIVGGLVGSLLAAHASDGALSGLFGIVALLVATKMFLPLDHLRLINSIPRGVPGNLLAVSIGSVSSMMGIGGGTLSVPAMALAGGPIHKAVGTAAFFGLLLSVPGTIGYLFARPDMSLPGLTVGLVSFTAFVVIVPMSIFTAPFGARLAHSLERRTLSRLFGVFLSIIAVRMLIRTFQ